MARLSPAERVRARLSAVAGPELAATMPAGYQRLGRVLILRLPTDLERYGELIGEAWRKELHVATVLDRAGPIAGELREPRMRTLAGGTTETEVVEYGSRWRLDAARLMFAAGNRTERLRFARALRPGERVVDLFAGIGYFTVPAARAQPGASFLAVEKNPLAFAYLEQNLRRNGVAGHVRTVLGDNRAVTLPLGSAERVLLGYLPSSLPWLPRALELLAPGGGMVHTHLVVDARKASEGAVGLVGASVENAGGKLLGPPLGREVKPYGPGRVHVVVDARVRPP